MIKVEKVSTDKAIETSMKVEANKENQTTTASETKVIETESVEGAISEEVVEEVQGEVNINTEDVKVDDINVEADSVDEINGIEINEEVNIDGQTIDGAISQETGMEPVNGEGLPEMPMYEGTAFMDPGLEAGMAKVKDPILSSWIFVIGISVLVLVISSGLGALLAARKIKKGIELYED